MDVDRVFSRHGPADADEFFADREPDFLAFDQGEVVGVAAVVALQRHQAHLFLVVPDELAGGILHVEIDVVGMFVGPRHGDEELGLLRDLAVIDLGMHGDEGEEEQEGDDLQRLEQHHREGVEPVVADVDSKTIHSGYPQCCMRRAAGNRSWSTRRPHNSHGAT